MSDHVDWPSFLEAIELCDPDRVWIHHGYSAVAARYLRSQGRDAIAIDRSSTRSDSEEADEDRWGDNDAIEKGAES